MNKCMWLSDQYSYICCNGDAKPFVADACPFNWDPESPAANPPERCMYYEELEGKENG